MRQHSKRMLALPCLMLGALLVLAGTAVRAQQPGEKPIGWSKMRAANSPIKPIYASEIDKEMDALKTKADQMADEVKKAKVNPEADSVEKAWPDSISLERHQADIAEFRDKFTRCMTAMEHQIQAKIDSGTVTTEDKAQFKKCMDHCKAILATLNDMHYNTSAMTTATKKIYFLSGWEKHKKLIAQLQEQMKTCPSLMKGSMGCCNMQGMGMGNMMNHMNMPMGSGATNGGADSKQPAASDVTYTCPMHPQVVKSEPGKCPLCGMNLVPKKK